MLRSALVAVAAVALVVPARADGPGPNGPAPSSIKVELSGYSVDLSLPGTLPPAKVVRGLIDLQGRSSLGPVTATNLAAQFDFMHLVVPPPEWCSGDTVIFAPLVGSGYLGLRFEATGELLEAKTVAGPGAGLCYDYVTTHSTGRASGPVIAGTGRFAGAQGTIQIGFSSYCADPPDCALSPMLQTVKIELEK